MIVDAADDRRAGTTSHLARKGKVVAGSPRADSAYVDKSMAQGLRAVGACGRHVAGRLRDEIIGDNRRHHHHRAPFDPEASG